MALLLLCGLCGSFSNFGLIVLVTHEPVIAEYAHRVIYINDGIIAGDERKERK